MGRKTALEVVVDKAEMSRNHTWHTASSGDPPSFHQLALSTHLVQQVRVKLKLVIAISTELAKQFHDLLYLKDLIWSRLPEISVPY